MRAETQNGRVAAISRVGRPRFRGWRGLTLAEMLVVLVILAGLAVVAVQSMEGVINQKRHELTRTALEDVRQAIVGDLRLRDDQGRAVITGFVADVGWVPRDMQDLLALHADLDPHALRQIQLDPNGDDDNFGDNDGDELVIQLWAGWKGPYLQPGVGAAVPVDGWGNPLELNLVGSTLLVTSRGADGLPGGVNYAADLDETIPLALTAHQPSVVGTLSFQVREGSPPAAPTLSGNEKVAVLVYTRSYNVADRGGIVRQQLPALAGPNWQTLPMDEPQVPIGQSAAVAIKWDDADNDDLYDPSELVVAHSLVEYFTVTPGQTPSPKMLYVN